MKAIISTLLIWAAIILACCANKSSESSSHKVDGMEGWEVIAVYEYDSGKCVLYTKLVKGFWVHWSICTGISSVSTSVSTK